MDSSKIIALRIERQHFTHKANETDYIALYRDMQPGQNVYWNGFGDPPSLTYRADFDDIAYNRQRQADRTLAKGRFTGGNLGWVMAEDLELFACLYCKPLSKPTPRHTELLELIERQGPLNIQQMKESTGMLVKEITPALHRLQEAFLIYEDQHDGEWDRGWYRFYEMFPDVNVNRYTRLEALKIVLQRFAYRHVQFDIGMAKSYYKLSEKEIKAVIAALLEAGVLAEIDDAYFLQSDLALLETYAAVQPRFIHAMHRNDFLVKSNEHWLKERYTHSYPDTMYYLLIDGEFRGVVAGKFRYTPEIEDVMLDLPEDEAVTRKDEILQAVHYLCGANNKIERFQGKELQ